MELIEDGMKWQPFACFLYAPYLFYDLDHYRAERR
jgi:hypothetical protein